MRDPRCDDLFILYGAPTPLRRHRGCTQLKVEGVFVSTTSSFAPATVSRLLQPIPQELCTFVDDHALFDDGGVNISFTNGGKRIAAAMGSSKAVIVRNHGLMTVGGSVDPAVGFFLQMWRAQVYVRLSDARPIDDDAAQFADRRSRTGCPPPGCPAPTSPRPPTPPSPAPRTRARWG